jgi:hypothetical protein
MIIEDLLSNPLYGKLFMFLGTAVGLLGGIYLIAGINALSEKIDDWRLSRKSANGEKG